MKTRVDLDESVWYVGTIYCLQSSYIYIEPNVRTNLIFMYTRVFSMLLSERWVVCLCNEPMAVQSARHDSRLKFLPIT